MKLQGLNGCVSRGLCLGFLSGMYGLHMEHAALDSIMLQATILLPLTQQ